MREQARTFALLQTRREKHASPTALLYRRRGSLPSVARWRGLRRWTTPRIYPPNRIERQMNDTSASARADAARKAQAAASGDVEYRIGDPGAFARNMVEVGIQSQRLLTEFGRRQAEKFGTTQPLDPLNITGAF